VNAPTSSLLSNCSFFVFVHLIFLFWIKAPALALNTSWSLHPFCRLIIVGHFEASGWPTASVPHVSVAVSICEKRRVTLNIPAGAPTFVNLSLSDAVCSAAANVRSSLCRGGGRRYGSVLWALWWRKLAWHTVQLFKGGLCPILCGGWGRNSFCRVGGGGLKKASACWDVLWRVELI